MTMTMTMTNTIQLVAIDMDGTLLNSRHQLSPGNEAALRRAQEAGIQIVFATGKTRTSAIPIIDKLKLATPGVYSQGLVVYDGDGSILYERRLAGSLARKVADFVQEANCSMVAYSGDDIVTSVRDAYTDVFIKYHEPAPIAYGSWTAVFAARPINKFIIVSTRERIDQIRPRLEQAIGHEATIVQALDYMVEILPPGASKGDGLRRVLAHLQVDPAQVMAIGDGENDVEMLALAGVGVAMGNAMPAARQAADLVTGTNDEDGVAQALARFLY
jgi:Cof subfamily protein (haloacid dehalogenase superfamily)